MATSTSITRVVSVKQRTNSKAIPPQKPKAAAKQVAMPQTPAVTASKARPQSSPHAAAAPKGAAGRAITNTGARRGQSDERQLAKSPSQRGKTPSPALPLVKGKGVLPVAPTVPPGKSPRGQLPLALAAQAIEPDVKAKRARVPKDLAAQYSEKTKKPRAIQAPESAATPRKRRDAAARERLRQAMAPTDDIVRRLARAGAIASVAVADDDESTAKARRKNAVTTRRPRHWETRCGKCGTNGQFKAAAGLCARCGAIVVRDGIGT